MDEGDTEEPSHLVYSGSCGQLCHLGHPRMGGSVSPEFSPGLEVLVLRFVTLAHSCQTLWLSTAQPHSRWPW